MKTVRYHAPWLVQEIVDLYRSGLTLEQVAESTMMCSVTIRRILIRAKEPLRGRNKGWRCVDCGKGTQGALRCPFHLKIRKSYTDRMAARRFHKIPLERWRLDRLDV